MAVPTPPKNPPLANRVDLQVPITLVNSDKPIRCRQRKGQIEQFKEHGTIWEDHQMPHEHAGKRLMLHQQILNTPLCGDHSVTQLSNRGEEYEWIEFSAVLEDAQWLGPFAHAVQ
jgi:hypothetical protein